MKLISAVEAACKISEFTKIPMVDLVDLFGGIDAVDAVPVVHGRWLFKEEGMTDWDECSICGHKDFNWSGSNYCPNCGARMDGDE